EHRLRVHVLREHLRSGETSIRVDREQPEVFSSNRILIGSPQKPEAVGRNQLIDRVRIHAELPLIFLYGPRVLSAAKDQFFFELAFRLHLVYRNCSRNKDRSRGQEENQCGKRETRMGGMGLHTISRSAATDDV